MGNDIFTFNLDDLFFYYQESAPNSCITHYVFISAFCCSTLLARFLDQLDTCLVLKEPAVIPQVATFTHLAEATAREKAELSKLALFLMRRAFTPDQTVIIKPSDIGNAVAPLLMEQDHRSKGVILSIDLRTFILSVLKSPSRRHWTRGRVRFWKQFIPEYVDLLDAVGSEIVGDAQCAGFVWLVNNIMWTKMKDKVEDDRILVIDGDDIANEMVTTVAKILNFFQISFTMQRLCEILSGESVSKHSKRPEEAYSPDQRRHDISTWKAKYGKETESAIVWTLKWAERLGYKEFQGPVLR